MANIFTEIRLLKDEGKLHTKLITRTRMLFGVSLCLFCTVIFNVLFRHLNILFILCLVLIGLFMGLYVFTKMGAVSWNEEEEVVKASKMDVLGYATLGLYILFEVSVRTFFKDYFSTQAVPLLLAIIFGTILGRAIGTLLQIHKVYTSQHSE